MKHFFVVSACIVALAVNAARGQNFDPTPISFTPINLVEFKLNLPIVHLDINDYVPSRGGVYSGQATAIRFYNRVQGWTNLSLFMRVRWDADLDASNGVSWSDWFQDNNENAYATVTKVFPTPGKYAVTVEIEFFTSNGAQAYSRQKKIDLFVAPFPTAVYADHSGNRLFYWEGYDHLFDKPALLVEGYDPDGSTTAEINYMLGNELIELGRTQGYEVFIMEWGNGGADLTLNKDVFLGACQFLHAKLGPTEAAVQVVGISMGGTIGRYGLAWAEDDISPNAHPSQHVEHYVNTFISFDSPQQGSHVNTDLQYFIRHNGNSKQQQALTKTAAMQMLYESTYDPESHRIHDDFYGGMQALHNAEQPYGYTNGYPRRCKNFAVSNGNRNANYPNKTPNDLLAKYTQYANVDLLDITVVHLFPRSTTLIHAQPRDLWPGSTFTHDLTTISSQGTFYYYVGLDGYIDIASLTGGWKFQVYFNPSYNPTESALDFKGDYSRASDGSLIGGTSWFDDNLMQTTFHRHEELTNESKDKVMEWLNNNRTNPYLGRPSNVAAQVTSYKQVKITFQDEAAFEQGFTIERKAGDGSYVEIASIGHNSNQFIDYCTTPTTTYSYRLSSFSGNSQSAYSTEVSVTTPAVANIQTPTGLVSRGEPNYISLSWAQVPGATGYRIYRSLPGQACPMFSADVTSNGYQDLLPDQQQYSYQVAALSGTTEGPLSAASTSQALHFASSIPSPLSPNAQRKLVQSSFSNVIAVVPPTFYMVYESGSSAFFSKYNDGIGWDSELPIGGYASANSSSRNPTLVLDSVGQSVGVIYDKVVGYTHTIQYDGYDQWRDGDLGPIFSLGSFATSTDFQPMPSALWTKSRTGKPSVLAAVWRKYDNVFARNTICFGLGTWTTSNTLPHFAWSAPRDMSDLIGDQIVEGVHPGIAVDLTPPNAPVRFHTFYVVWEDPNPTTGGIRLIRGAYNNSNWPPQASLAGWGSVLVIAANSSSCTNSKPTIAVDASGNVLVAWEYRNTANPVNAQGEVRVQRRDYGMNILGPTYTTVASGTGVTNIPFGASLSDYKNSASKGNDFTVVFTIPSKGTMCAHFISGLWTSAFVVDPTGQQASVQTTINSSDVRNVIDVRATGPPYGIQFIPIAALPPPPAAPQSLSWSTTTDAYGRRVPKLTWRKVNGAANYRVSWYSCVYGQGDCQGDASVVGTTTDTTFTDYGTIVWLKTSPTPPSSTVYYTVAAFDNFNQSSSPSNRILVNSSDGFAQKQGWSGDNHETRPAPSETRLIANYPNPFNPSTTISYQLAEPGFVSMHIYDMLGEEVAALVEAEQGAGYFTAIWDGSNSSSGIYYLRMAVSAGSGKDAYHITRKLLLMK